MTTTTTTERPNGGRTDRPTRRPTDRRRRPTTPTTDHRIHGNDRRRRTDRRPTHRPADRRRRPTTTTDRPTDAPTDQRRRRQNGRLAENCNRRPLFDDYHQPPSFPPSTSSATPSSPTLLPPGSPSTARTDHTSDKTHTQNRKRNLPLSEGGAARGYYTRPFAARLWDVSGGLPVWLLGRLCFQSRLRGCLERGAGFSTPRGSRHGVLPRHVGTQIVGMSLAVCLFGCPNLFLLTAS